MALKNAGKKTGKKEIKQYEHSDKKRLNNPPVGLVNESTEPYSTLTKEYQHDPHLDPQLVWAGKAEHISFEVPTVSLHVHERIDPRTIISKIQKTDDSHKQMSLFETEKKPLRSALEFYQHREGWSNRLIAGDSLLVINSLLEKEGMAGKVQMVYIDPPYGIKYGSNFQPFVNNRDVKDGRDEDLTAEPEMIKAFRDTWELGIHSYLAYLRDRLLLIRELLNVSGSVFVQISDENVHRVRLIMDEIFGQENFVCHITFRKKLMPLGAKTLETMNDFILWYCKEKTSLKYHQLFVKTEPDPNARWTGVELKDGSRRMVTTEEHKNISLVPKDARIFATVPQIAPSYSEKSVFPFEFEGKIYYPPDGSCWVTTKEKMELLANANRLIVEAEHPRYIMYHEDFPYSKITNPWNDTPPAQGKVYVVQTNPKVIERCLLMTTDPGDLVADITCGSGTTAYVAEKWGRRWITCETSRVALTLSKQRLMTSIFDYYELAYPDEGIGSGFKYNTLPRISLKSIANSEPPQEETFYDQPFLDKKKTRITGPFTVEAVPSPRAKSIEEIEQENHGAGESIVRTGETLRQTQWRDELLRSGVRAKGGKMIQFTRVEPLSGTKWIQAEAETKEDKPKKVLVVFGPEHAPLEQRVVENAWQEARLLHPEILLFCAFQFDEEAAKDIDELRPEIAGMQLLKALMNADLFIEDLKKKRVSNESFWLIGQPDVKLTKINKGEDKGKYQVEVLGFDYYNPKTGNVETGGKGNIAMWHLDTDYDNRSLFPSQVFFPMAGEKNGWAKLAKSLKAEVDEEKIEAYRGTVSLPFEKEKNGKIAVKIIDDRGIESLRIITL